ncbi:hypothetical protein [Litchfieldella rifensis]|uniref:Glycosyltransferase n=1 Tax=Litchfieldella rifensis TaxID=762643 RepID=A0ABV7LTK2_9GAMM
MKILFLVPSKLDGPSARYVIDLSLELIKSNLDVLISSESESCVIHRNKNKCVNNIKLPNIENFSYFNSYISSIIKEKIHVVISIGSRVKIDLISLHLKKSGVFYIKQFEDDEETIFVNCNPKENSGRYQELIKESVKENISNVDLEGLHKSNYRIIDPYLKGLTLSALDGYAKIWGGLKYDEEGYIKNKRWFQLPPVCSESQIYNLEKIICCNEEDDNVHYFLAGSIYSVEDAEIFLKAWMRFKANENKAVLNISKSRTSKKVLDVIDKKYQGRLNIKLLDLKDDNDYQLILAKATYVVSIGGGQFDEKRLPSRLVKAMFLKKIIITPSAGFGNSLSDEINSIICYKNTTLDWCDALERSFLKKSDNSIKQEAYKFAQKHFNIKKVSKELVKYIAFSVNKENLATDSRFRDAKRLKSIRNDVENNLMADHFSILKNLRPQPIKRIKFRLIFSGDCLFVQTLDRADYSYQVECSAESLIRKNQKSSFLDSGFIYLHNHGECNVFGYKIKHNLSKEDFFILVNLVKGKFSYLAPSQRSRLFDKLKLTYRLYLVAHQLIQNLKISNIIFHADMQSTEAILSSLINELEKDVSTISLQHALFYDTNDENDLNIVNSRVSPSAYSFFWDDHVSSIVCKHNPRKVAVNTHPIPSFLFKNMDFNQKKSEFLAILDGPNHHAYNLQLLDICDKLVDNKKISCYDIKVHPYHSQDFVNEINQKFKGKVINQFGSSYENVVFISSSLGYDFNRVGSKTFQYVSSDLLEKKDIYHHPKIFQFKDFDTFLKGKSLLSTEKNNTIVGKSGVLEYQKSFIEALDFVRKKNKLDLC